MSYVIGVKCTECDICCSPKVAGPLEDKDGSTDAAGTVKNYVPVEVCDLPGVTVNCKLLFKITGKTKAPNSPPNFQGTSGPYPVTFNIGDDGHDTQKIQVLLSSNLCGPIQVSVVPEEECPEKDAKTGGILE